MASNLRVEVFMGISGRQYSWNRECTLNGYQKESRLNAIELNTRFYRLPFPNQRGAWAIKTILSLTLTFRRVSSIYYFVNRRLECKTLYRTTEFNLCIWLRTLLLFIRDWTEYI